MEHVGPTYSLVQRLKMAGLHIKLEFPAASSPVGPIWSSPDIFKFCLFLSLSVDVTHIDAKLSALLLMQLLMNRAIERLPNEQEKMI